MELKSDSLTPQPQPNTQGRQKSMDTGGSPSIPPPSSSGGAYIPRPDLSAAQASKKSGRGWWLLAACIGCAAALGLGLMHSKQAGAPTTPTASQTQAAGPVQHEKILVVSDRDLDKEATQSARAALERGEIPTSLANASPEIRQQVQSGEKNLFSLRVYDTRDEDGDVVSVFLDNAPYGTVPLSHAGTMITLALKPHGSTLLRIVASYDGGGGVTFGAKSSEGEARTQVMTVGEKEDWILNVK